FYQVIAVGTRIRQPRTYTVKHVADTAQRTLDSVGRFGDEVGAEFYWPQCSAPERLTKRLGLGHFFQRGNSVELVQTQLGELTSVKREFAVACVDIKNAHHAVAPRNRLDRIV